MWELKFIVAWLIACVIVFLLLRIRGHNNGKW
jgi:hypothetical protein